MKIEEYKSAYRIEEVIGRSISLKQQGTQMVGICPFHDDHESSLKISPAKQIFKCFACDEGGDVFDFFTKQGFSIAETKSIIADGTVIPYSQPTATEPVIVWRDAVPNQNSLPNVAALRFKDYGNPVAFWAYHNAEGAVISYVCRFDLGDGKKDVIPYTSKTDGKITRWRWQGLDLKRPVYNLHLLAQRPNDTVLIVEGEKTCDAATKLFPQYVCITWPGGGNSTPNIDWTPLHGRNILLWADNDVPGIQTMYGGWRHNEKTGEYKRIHGICEIFPANFKQVRNQPDFPKKWDVADADWNEHEAREYVLTNRADVPLISDMPPNVSASSLVPLGEPMAADETDIETPASTESTSSNTTTPTPPIQTPVDSAPYNPFFKCLGYEKQSDQHQYVFFVYRTNIVIKLTAGGISSSNILQMAPLVYWESSFPKRTRAASGPQYDMTAIMDYLIETCGKIGIFNINRIRGRGAWLDNGVPVIHCGDCLVVDGHVRTFAQHRSKYIYESAQELGFNMVKPLGKVDANKLIKMLDRLNWSRNVSSRLLAGWIVTAPLCGALKWRSHVWITGPAGSGKTEVLKMFIKAFMGNILVHVQGSTTEAGIRQYLKADALPVIFDEAESEGPKAASRMQDVLEMMRGSSASDSGNIIKGSSGGGANMFDIKSCFAFSSIGITLNQRADSSRITVCELKKDDSTESRKKWNDTLKMHLDTVTDDYVQAFISRSITMLPTILQNARVFSTAAAQELDNQRTGDQLGILLAGAYSLTSDGVIDLQTAKNWIHERDWEEEKLIDATLDEVKVLRMIIDAETEVESVAGKIKRTIGELIIIARGDVVKEKESNTVSEELAQDTLGRLGIKVIGFDVLFRNGSAFIRRALQGSAYAGNYESMLIRVNGAAKVNDIKFGSHLKSRAVKIDSREIFGDFENPGMTQTHMDLNL